MHSHYNISSCGDHAITIEFGNAINKTTHQYVMVLFNYLSALNIDSIKDIIPAYTTVTIVYDVVAVKRQTSSTAYQFIKAQIENALQQLNDDVEEQTSLVTIPVCYDTSLGIDLETIASQKNISIKGIINLHASTIYDVYMIGFLPGFAYMGVVDEKIATPRLSKPRMQVPAGSVGIAGNQTGIYPLASPGGWNIIGQTPLKMFDINKPRPCLLNPGDKVQFQPISLEEFNNYKQA